MKEPLTLLNAGAEACHHCGSGIMQPHKTDCAKGRAVPQEVKRPEWPDMTLKPWPDRAEEWRLYALSLEQKIAEYREALNAAWPDPDAEDKLSPEVLAEIKTEYAEFTKQRTERENAVIERDVLRVQAEALAVALEMTKDTRYRPFDVIDARRKALDAYRAGKEKPRATEP